MKFGLNIINFGPGASPASMKASVLSAEDAGFQLAMLSDHVAITPDVARAYPEGLAALGAEYVVLDTYHGNPDALTDTAVAQHTLDMLGEQVINAAAQTLR